MSLSSNGGNKMVTSRNYIGSIPRTIENRNLETRTTFSAGELFPIYCEEIYPAHNKKVFQKSFVRSITPLGPVMDHAFLDVFYFFVPFRLIWDHWEEFIAGYNKEAWNQDVEYVTPQIKFKIPANPGLDSNIYLGSFFDHVPGLGDPIELYKAIVLGKAAIDAAEGDEAKAAAKEKYEGLIDKLFGFSALYPRAYVKIWNDWFRDENLQDELELYTGDNDEYATDFAFDLLSVTSLPKAGKYHNRYTTALPRPVKGPDVLIPMNDLEIKTPQGVDLSLTYGTDGKSIIYQENEGYVIAGEQNTSGSSRRFNGINAVASNVSNTIRMLRLATQTELLLSRDARGGTRYVESLLSHWATHNGDARLQRSEYLGSRQIPLSVIQVTNTAQSSDGVLGNVGAQSATKDGGLMFNKAFSEYGVVLGLACVRTNLSYGSGRRKQFTRKGRFDYIWPEFRHVGDVELMATELDQNTAYIDEGVYIDQVLGFTPYGSELREGYNANTGLFRARASGSLGYLTYQEVFEDDEIPSIYDEYISQSSSPVANTLVDQNGPQYYALFRFEETQVIALDPTSDPGLMDHF